MHAENCVFPEGCTTKKIYAILNVKKEAALLDNRNYLDGHKRWCFEKHKLS